MLLVLSWEKGLFVFCYGLLFYATTAPRIKRTYMSKLPDVGLITMILLSDIRECGVHRPPEVKMSFRDMLVARVPVLASILSV